MRAEDAKRAAVLYVNAGAVRMCLPVDPNSFGDDSDISVMRVPSPTGSSGDLRVPPPARFLVGEMNEAEVHAVDLDSDDFLEADYSDGPTIVMLVSLEGPGGQRDRLVEATSAGEAKDIAVQADGDEVSSVFINRIPLEDGPEGVLEWDGILEMRPSFSAEPCP